MGNGKQCNGDEGSFPELITCLYCDVLCHHYEQMLEIWATAVRSGGFHFLYCFPVHTELLVDIQLSRVCTEWVHILKPFCLWPPELSLILLFLSYTKHIRKFHWLSLEYAFHLGFPVVWVTFPDMQAPGPECLQWSVHTPVPTRTKLFKVLANALTLFLKHSCFILLYLLSFILNRVTSQDAMKVIDMIGWSCLLYVLFSGKVTEAGTFVYFIPRCNHIVRAKNRVYSHRYLLNESITCSVGSHIAGKSGRWCKLYTDSRSTHVSNFYYKKLTHN